MVPDATGVGAAAQDIIVATGLTKRYGTFTAVDGLDLTVRKGEIFGLLGPNGAGKTTTILMLLGLTEPTAGTVRVAGFDPVRDPLSVKAIVGYLPDNVGFYPHMTGRQNLLYTASLNRVPRKEAGERVDDLLDQVGLTDAADKRAGKYSRGMRQRLAVADALVKRPSILILDEPTIGIDPEGVRDPLGHPRHPDGDPLMEAADPFVFERPEWHSRAACRGVDPELFFPAKGEDPSIVSVLYCSRCPVTEDCLDHALRREREGVWAGTSDKQRRQIRRERRIRLEVMDLDPMPDPTSDHSEGDAA
jgi:ABC-type lipopolysaccharide export system ATPase subunit